ncbi:MAG: hypothetical protein ACYDIE_06465 [Candidatus Krumholzibacteriia bacterium]
MKTCRTIPVLAAIALAALLSAASPAGAGCLITGVCSASPNTVQPCVGAWQYTLTVDWDTGTKCAPSHFDLLIAAPGSACDCPAVDRALNWLSPVGSAAGVPAGCTVPFEGLLSCYGDPSACLSDLLLKFEPTETDVCTLPPSGQAVFTLYSDYPPAPISEPNLFLVDKTGQLVCYGSVTGVFPGLPCDPTATESSSWGSQKSAYR